MRSRKEMRFGIPLFDRMTGRYRPHLSLREGLEKPPFPLALHRVESVLAVKGSLRRFAPWTAPGRSEGMTVYEGKEGIRQIGAILHAKAVSATVVKPFGFGTGDGEGSRCGIRTRIALQNPVAQVVVAILWGHVRTAERN